MKKTRSLKLLLVIITAIAALFACVFIIAPKEQRTAEAATTLPVLEEVKATMPTSLTNTNTSNFNISLAIDYVAGSKCNQITFKFIYDTTKVDYVSYKYDDMQSATGGEPVDVSGKPGWKSVSLTSGSINERHNVKMMTFTFKLKSGLKAGDKVAFNFDSFKSPLVYNNKPITPTVNDGTLVLPKMEISITAPSTVSTLKSLTVSGVSNLSNNGNTYTGSVPYSTSSVTINATPTDGNAKISGAGNFPLSVGENTREVVVTAQAGGSNQTKYTVKITRQEGEKTADLTEVKLTKGDKTLTGNISGTDVTFNESIEYADKDGWTLAAKAGGKATVTAGNGPVTLTGGDNTVTVTVQPQQGSATNFNVKINVVQASTDTTLAGDPQVFNGTEKLTLNSLVPEIRLYTLRYPAGTQSLSVVAVPNDSAATVKIHSLALDNDTPIGQYDPNEPIPLTEEVERLRVVVTAESGTPTTYTIMLYEEKAPATSDPTNPDQPEKPKFITFNFGDSELEIAKDETDKKFEVPKGTTSLDFSITVIEGVTVNMLYGVKEVDETGTETASLRALVAYAEETTEEGTVKKYRVELAEGNNPILMTVNESGIAGDDVIYALNVNRPVEAGSNVGMLVAVIVLAVLLAAAIVAIIVLIILKKKNGGDDDTPAAVVEETPEYTVEFKMNGHGKQVKKQKTEKGLVTEPEAPVAQGYVFGGWYKDEKCTEKFDFAQTVEKDLTVYAQWTEEPKPEPVVEEKVAQEQVVEEAPAEEPKKEEKPTEEAPAEEPKKEEKPAEEAIAEEHEEEENGDDTTIKIRNVLTHKEKYENLSHEQKVFYDELKMRALTVPGAILSSNRSNETVRLGQRRIIKLMIRRDYVVACFFAENESVTNLKKALRGKDIRINTKETEIPIYDVNAFEAAEEMLQILIEGIYRR